MNVMVDTNILLDDLLDRVPYHENACQITRMITDKKIFGYVTVNSLTDIYYVVGKNLNETIAREAIRKIIGIFQVLAVDENDCNQALDLPIGDFEDALVVVCAEKAALNYIITNDKAFLNQRDLPVRPISPADFLLEFEG